MNKVQHCGISQIRTRDRCLSSLAGYQLATYCIFNNSYQCVASIVEDVHQIYSKQNIPAGFNHIFKPAFQREKNKTDLLSNFPTTTEMLIKLNSKCIVSYAFVVNFHDLTNSKIRTIEKRREKQMYWNKKCSSIF